MQDFADIENGLDQISDPYKMPPHSIEAEQAVLGGLMLDNNAWDKVADLLIQDDFYRRDHGLIFSAIAVLADSSQPCDVVTISEWLNNNDELGNAGGLPYLGTLANNTPSAANIKSYAGIVRERSVLRQLIRVGTEITDSAFNTEGRNSVELLDTAEQSVFKIAEQGSRSDKGYKAVSELLANVVDRIDMLATLDSSITGISTGFDDFDEMTAGLQESDLIIVAGRPSMGKTTFAMNIAEYAAISGKLSVAVFSMEMPGEALVMRMLSSLSRVDQNRVRSGKLDDDDWAKLTSSMSLLSESKLFIDDTPALSPTELRARARRIKREHDLDLVVIDYLQLMQVAGSSENRTNEISEISRGLKTLAKELNVPVIALSQLNRSLEQRTDKRPIMSDLRESGAIEQDADVISFVYRDEVYNRDDPDNKGRAEIIIGKQRNGPIGMVPLTFNGMYTRFDNYAGEQDYYEGGYE